MRKEKHVAEWKIKKVAEIEQFIEKYPLVAVVNLEALPNKQLQDIRRKLGDKMKMIITKKILYEKALENKKINFDEYLKGSPALLFSNESAFELFRLLKENRVSAAAKPGQIAPNDITVPAGPTPFTPGPIISDLGALGLKNKVEEGKIVIIEDAVIAKEGEAISPKAASLLAQLGVEPMQIGINLVVARENGEIYTKAILDVDVDEFTNKIKSAASDSFKLAVELGIINSQTAEYLVSKAFREAKHLAEEANVLSKETAPQVLSKAEGGAQALKKLVKSQPEETSEKSGDDNQENTEESKNSSDAKSDNVSDSGGE
jgi:large subunit ribosomal protein L10